ncbi:hypothetical protein DPMN_104710 [Dreissena polymorpha]|uniref:Uncharacterized protein n=1 Tax=Dreissena polymorpha TaxID=45954 RepID=A0A9D4HA95_DREPO|nr:hypothetical protein DPMN_104710 [Dreissena polymorpha]
MASGMSNLDDMINVLKDIINKTKVKNNETTGATVTPDKKLDTKADNNNIGNNTFTSPTVSTQFVRDLNEATSESDPWNASVYYNIFNSSLDQSNHTINTQSQKYSLLLTSGTISGRQNPQNNTQTILFTNENTSQVIHTTAAVSMSTTHAYVQDNLDAVEAFYNIISRPWQRSN